MTENEWLACVKVTVPLMNWLRGHGSDRKFRLAGCAALRHVWEAIDLPAARELIELSELVADGQVDVQRLQRLVSLVERDIDASMLQPGRRRAATQAAAYLGMHAGYQAGYSAMVEAARVGKRAIQWHWQCRMLRDIFGNPFRPVQIDPAWLSWHDRTIPSLAQAAYDERDLPSGQLAARHLAILADALEEAGCGNEEVLAHLRGPDPHVRGCWVVDGLLDKK